MGACHLLPYLQVETSHHAQARFGAFSQSAVAVRCFGAVLSEVWRLPLGTSHLRACMRLYIWSQTDHLLLGFILCQAARRNITPGGCIHTQSCVTSLVSLMAMSLGSVQKHSPGDVGGCRVRKLGRCLQNPFSTNSHHAAVEKEGEIFYAGSKEIKKGKVSCSPVKCVYKEPLCPFCCQILDQKHVLLFIWVKEAILHLNKWKVVVIFSSHQYREREKINLIIKIVDYI